jgi:hypothetical protein
VGRASDHVGHVGLLEDVIFGFTLVSITTRCDKCRWVFRHVVCMVVDDDQAIAEGMWGGDINWTPKIRGEVEKGTGRFCASSSVAWCSIGLVKQA